MSILKELTEHLDISFGDLAINMVNAPVTYKVFKIPKRTGGKRTIEQPTQFVKGVQRGIVAVLLEQFETLDSTMAYVKGRSIVDNANAHVGGKFILKMDFENFFPSIKPIDLSNFLNKQNIEIPKHELKFLVNYLFRKSDTGLHLSIGAPSSPMISNLVMYEIDTVIQTYCDSLSITYTRYADDLTFSSPSYDVLSELSKWIKDLVARIASPSLKVNERKTKIIGVGKSRRVTGVILTNDGRISVGRHSRKKIRAMVYQYQNDVLDKNDIPYLHGFISHLRHIEPDHFKKLVNTFGEDIFVKLAKQSFFISKMSKAKQIKNN